MLKRFTWRENDVYFITVTETVSTVIQLLKKPYVVMFHAFSNNSIASWNNVNLHDIEEYRVIRVLQTAIKHIAQQKLEAGTYIPKNDVVLPKHFISKDFIHRPDTATSQFNLVYIDPSIGDLGIENKIVEANIFPRKTLEQLEPYELIALHTAKDLMSRLFWSYSITFGMDKYKEYYLKGIMPIPVNEWEEEYRNGGGIQI